MISTLPVYLTSIDRKIASKPPGANRKVVNVVQQQTPSQVIVYNKTMGGVDTLGYFLSMVQFDFRQQKWTTKVSIETLILKK